MNAERGSRVSINVRHPFVRLSVCRLHFIHVGIVS